MAKKYYWVKVQLLSGKIRWYWCTPKLTKALNVEKELRPTSYRKSLIGNYLVVPYRPYLNQIEHLTLGKVLNITRSNHRNYSWQQTRSQFLTKDNIGTKVGYQYIKHDYHFLTRVHLFISNISWGIKNKNGRKAKHR